MCIASYIHIYPQMKHTIQVLYVLHICVSFLQILAPIRHLQPPFPSSPTPGTRPMSSADVENEKKAQQMFDDAEKRLKKWLSPWEATVFTPPSTNA